MIENQNTSPRKFFQLSICPLGSDEMIGDVGIRLRGLGGHETDVPQADVGYEINPKYWGQGFATEAAIPMMDIGFNSLGVYRLWSQCIAENRASARVLEKLGMRLEGRLRQHEFFKGRYWDTLIYAILVDEWRSNRVK
jgi:RimJ/RimL family protein N-acetyltransferase